MSGPQAKPEIKIPTDKSYTGMPRLKKYDVSPNNGKFSADEIAKMPASDALYIFKVGFKRDPLNSKKTDAKADAKVKKEEKSSQQDESLSTFEEASKVFLKLPNEKIAAILLEDASGLDNIIAREYFPRLYKSDKQRAVGILLMLDDNAVLDKVGYRKGAILSQKISSTLDNCTRAANNFILPKNQSSATLNIDWNSPKNEQRRDHPQRIELEIKNEIRLRDPGFARKYITVVDGA